MWTEDFQRRFDFHQATQVSQVRHASVRDTFKETAFELARLPDGREKSLAFTALEEASFWAHAAIAREVTVVG